MVTVLICDAEPGLNDFLQRGALQLICALHHEAGRRQNYRRTRAENLDIMPRRIIIGATRGDITAERQFTGKKYLAPITGKNLKSRPAARHRRKFGRGKAKREKWTDLHLVLDLHRFKIGVVDA